MQESLLEVWREAGKAIPILTLDVEEAKLLSRCIDYFLREADA